MSRKVVVSISGKGGVGKTTVAALILKCLIKATHNILAVDADPATNLPDVLGVKVTKTVGDVIDDLKKKVSEDGISSMMSKEGLLEAWIYEVLIESAEFDLLAMGKTEGEGCYCMVNRMLTKIVDSISRNYEVTLMDMEAGLEHLSRRTERDVDIMLVVTDASKMGIQTARRIKEVATEVHISFGKIYLVGNCVPSPLHGLIQEQSQAIGIELAGVVPPDRIIAEYNIEGKPLLGVPEDSDAYVAIAGIVDKIGLGCAHGFGKVRSI
ncbi:MAG: AAA family ATPase [Candidatus Bathyarchaeia archaeon]